MNLILLDFEQRTELGPTAASRLLGIAYATYAHYRSEHRKLPGYHAQSIEVLLNIREDELAAFIRKYVHGD
jgi:hypothetical protein